MIASRAPREKNPAIVSGNGLRQRLIASFNRLLASLILGHVTVVISLTSLGNTTDLSLKMNALLACKSISVSQLLQLTRARLVGWTDAHSAVEMVKRTTSVRIARFFMLER